MVLYCYILLIKFAYFLFMPPEQTNARAPLPPMTQGTSPLPQEKIYKRGILIFVVPFVTLATLYVAVMATLGEIATHYCTGWNDAGTGTISCSISWLAPYAEEGFNTHFFSVFTGGSAFLLPTVVGILCGIFWFKRIRRYKTNGVSLKLLAWTGLITSFISAVIFTALFWTVYLSPLTKSQKPPEGANSTTYKVITVSTLHGGIANSEYAVDNTNVYCNKVILTGADPQTFTLLPGNTLYDVYAKDAQHVYFGCNLIPEADAATFTRLQESPYAVDATHAYSSGRIIAGADVRTFGLVDEYFAKDAQHVYFYGPSIDGADPATFTDIDGLGLYQKDKNKVYYKGKVVSQADPLTFTQFYPALGCGTDCQHDGKDKNRSYLFGEPLNHI